MKNKSSRIAIYPDRTGFLFRSRRSCGGFTLVEMLVVVTIIGILASLITAAAVAARRRAKIAAVVTEISQLDMALKAYKERFGEYPPDGTDATAVTQHLAKAFPRYTGGLPAIMSGPGKLTPMTALGFWLGGMMDANGKLIGFSANQLDPFDTTSANRIGPFFEFDPNRRGLAGTYYTKTDAGAYRYWPSGWLNSPQYGILHFNGYAYLRADNGTYRTSAGGIKACGEVKAAVDTRIGDPTGTNPTWINPQSCQIFCAGADGTYVYPTAPLDRLLFPSGANYGTSTYGSSFDDITNFSNGTLEDAIP